MEKRNIYILIGAGVILIILIVLSMVLAPKKQPTRQNIETGLSSPTAATGNELSPQIGRSTLEDAAKGFYDWYIGHPNPLGSGDYQKSPYISADYKETMSGFVKRGDHLSSDPVLTCIDIKPPSNITTQREVYDNTQQMAYVQLLENVSGATPLYKVIFKKINQQWLIDDIRCIL